MQKWLGQLWHDDSAINTSRKTLEAQEKSHKFKPQASCWLQRRTGHRTKGAKAPDNCPVSVGDAAKHSSGTGQKQQRHRTNARRHRTFVRCVLRRDREGPSTGQKARVSHRTCTVTRGSDDRGERATGQSTRQGTGHLSGACKSAVAYAQQPTVRVTGQMSGAPESFVRCVAGSWGWSPTATLSLGAINTHPNRPFELWKSWGKIVECWDTILVLSICIVLSDTLGD
jgi:hypothetical protein